MGGRRSPAHDRGADSESPKAATELNRHPHTFPAFRRSGDRMTHEAKAEISSLSPRVRIEWGTEKEGGPISVEPDRATAPPFRTPSGNLHTECADRSQNPAPAGRAGPAEGAFTEDCPGWSPTGHGLAGRVR